MLPESLHVSVDLSESLHVSADIPESFHFSTDHPESHQVSADLPESLHITSDHPELRHITADQPESCHVLSATSRYPRSVLQYPRLASSVEDPPLLSVRAAGIPKPAPIPSSPYVPELISLFEALPRMGIAFRCVWAAYTTTESPKAAAHTVVSSEVVADAAEPPEVAALAVMFQEAMAPAAVSPEVVAQAAVPPKAAVLVSVPSVLVPNNALTACHAELPLFPDGTALEPPEVAASATEHPDGGKSYQSANPCPVLSRLWRLLVNYLLAMI